MNNVFSTFTRCYPVSKTLRFALIPQGKTEENIQKYGMLSKDEEKAVYYPLVKEIFDQYHKAYIEDSLSAFVCDWTDLFEAFDKYSKDKLEYEKLYNDTAAKYQKKLSDHLKKKISEMDPEKIIKNALSGDTRIPLSESQIKSIRAFSGFSTYFEGYRIIRSNIYTANTPGSIAYRIVCENFPKFYWNCKTYNSLNDGAKALFNNETKELTGSLTLDEIFSPECFNYVLSQNGVDFYNTVIGGKTDSETSKKQGLNELCNLAYQSNKIPDKKKFSLLYKQILSDRESASFIPTPYDNDKEVKRDIITLCEYVCAQNNEELHSAFSSELSNHTNI